jgi:hypothetical protein
LIARLLLLSEDVPREWPARAVHDTVSAVMHGAAFQRSLQQSIVDRLFLWLGTWLEELFGQLRGSGLARSAAVGVAALLVLLVVAKLLLSARARGGPTVLRARGAAMSGEDPWRLAERLAAEARYEEAAHAIYHGVLANVSRSEHLRLDPSKTSGDYARELRARGSSAYAPFRAFGRRFEAAVYGHDRCDAALIDDLRRLAMPFAPRARAA